MYLLIIYHLFCRRDTGDDFQSLSTWLCPPTPRVLHVKPCRVSAAADHANPAEPAC